MNKHEHWIGPRSCVSPQKQCRHRDGNKLSSRFHKRVFVIQDTMLDSFPAPPLDNYATLAGCQRPFRRTS